MSAPNSSCYAIGGGTVVNVVLACQSSRTRARVMGRQWQRGCGGLWRPLRALVSRASMPFFSTGLAADGSGGGGGSFGMNSSIGMPSPFKNCEHTPIAEETRSPALGERPPPPGTPPLGPGRAFLGFAFEPDLFAAGLREEDRELLHGRLVVRYSLLQHLRGGPAFKVGMPL